jgi:hypothetical protein
MLLRPHPPQEHRSPVPPIGKAAKEQTMKTQLLTLVILIILGLALAGVAQAAPPNPGVQQSYPMDVISPATFTPIAAGSPQSGATAKPHPILSDVRVRQAIAYCTDKAGLLASVYPSLTPAQR